MKFVCRFFKQSDNYSRLLLALSLSPELEAVAVIAGFDDGVEWADTMA